MLNNWRTLTKLSSGRMWYHGTSRRRWAKIKADGYLRPFLADDDTYGEAVWFTSDMEGALVFGPVILAIDHATFVSLPHKRFNYPRGHLKKYPHLNEPNREYSANVFDPIPVSTLTVIQE